MSFFSKLKERASAVTKAAEKYMTAEEKSQAEGEEQPQQYKVKPKAKTPHAGAASDPNFSQEPRKEEGMKRQTSSDDPLQEMVRKAAEEFKSKPKPDSQEQMGVHGELQKLKTILRVKMKEYDDLVDETSKRDMEYQKLLQENEEKLQQVSREKEQLASQLQTQEQLRSDQTSPESHSQTEANDELKSKKHEEIIEKLKNGYLILEKNNEELTKELEGLRSQQEQPTEASTLPDEDSSAAPNIDFDSIKDLLSKEEPSSQQLKQQLVELLQIDTKPSVDHTEDLQKLNDELVKKSQEFEEMKSKFEQAREYLKQFNEKNKTLTAQNDKLETDVKALNEKLDQFKSEAEAGATAKSEVETKVSELEAKLKETQNANTQLKQDLEQHQATIKTTQEQSQQALEKLTQEKEQLLKQITESAKGDSDSQQALTQLEKERKEALDKIKNLEKQKEIQTKLLGDFQGKFKQANEAHQKEVQEIKAQSEQAQKNLIDVKSSLAKLQSLANVSLDDTTPVETFIDQVVDKISTELEQAKKVDQLNKINDS